MHFYFIPFLNKPNIFLDKNEEKIDNKTKNKILPGENIPVLCNINAGSETDKGITPVLILKSSCMS